MNRSPWASPWPKLAFSVVVALNLVGLVAILGGWFWAGGRTAVDGQIPAVALTVGGLVAAGLGDIAWLVSGRRGLAECKRAMFRPALERR